MEVEVAEAGPTEWGDNPNGVGPWTEEHDTPVPADPRYDPELLAGGDRRNVVDAYRYWTREAIVADIDSRRHPLHVAIENFGHDANIGTVVRTANAFAAAAVHIVGRRRWNRRGAMVTDRYQRLVHHDTTEDLLSFAAGRCLGNARALGPEQQQRAVRRWWSPSPNSARPAASTPPSPRASRCTPGSDVGVTSTPRGRERCWI